MTHPAHHQSIKKSVSPTLEIYTGSGHFLPPSPLSPRPEPLPSGHVLSTVVTASHGCLFKLKVIRIK